MLNESKPPTFNAYTGRTTLTLELENPAPIHVGAGFSHRPANGDGEIAEIMVDHEGKPWIPPTTLKGALRALLPATRATALFGEIRSNDTGRAGRLVISGASLTSWPKKAENNQAVPDLAVLARTAIDGSCGTAATNKLFHARAVPPGAIWTARMTLLGAWTEADKALVAQLLKALSEPEGLAMGRGKNAGMGMVRLSEITRVETLQLKDGKVERRSDQPAGWNELRRQAKAPLQTTAAWALTLTADGPFAATGPKGNDNKLKALRNPDGAVQLPGPSLKGALRAKAKWWLDLRRLRGESIDPAILDDLFGADSPAPVAGGGAGTGSKAYAGLLQIRAINSDCKIFKNLTSVRVDRFTMGAFQGALFEVEAAVNPVFKVSLELTDRPARSKTSRMELKEFVDSFLAMLAAPGPSGGLQLGHGANRGFGWFDVRFVRGGQSDAA